MAPFQLFYRLDQYEPSMIIKLLCEHLWSIMLQQELNDQLNCLVQQQEQSYTLPQLTMLLHELKNQSLVWLKLGWWSFQGMFKGCISHQQHLVHAKSQIKLQLQDQLGVSQQADSKQTLQLIHLRATYKSQEKIHWLCIWFSKTLLKMQF